MKREWFSRTKGWGGGGRGGGWGGGGGGGGGRGGEGWGRKDEIGVREEYVLC